VVRTPRQIVVGGPDVGQALADDHLVALLSATGSTRMGRAVGPRVAERFGPACWNWAATTPPWSREASTSSRARR
jgi:acyl-CoA reductase-like NAD-dependent aldehyde dehydrogenase